MLGNSQKIIVQNKWLLKGKFIVTILPIETMEMQKEGQIN